MRVLHLVGSPTSDFLRELSHLYAADCLDATFDPALYEFVIADVAPDGRWRFPAALDASALADAEPKSPSSAIAEIVELGIDVMIPQMFCVDGMTTYRALFDLLAIPFVGNRPAVMAMAADKSVARALVAQAGVRIPQGEVLRRGDTLTLDLPVVVKPVDADNSSGVTLVDDSHKIENALSLAWQHSDRAIAERFIELGREVRCATVVLDGELVCLPLEEYSVDALSKPIRDRADKLSRTADGDLQLMAKQRSHAWIVDVGDPVTAVVSAAARRCHRALGCRHYGLFDFRIDPDGHPWFLEASLYNSFARSSVIAMMAESAGIALDRLFAAGIAEALGETSNPEHATS